jgi:hypothetical protein
MGFKEKVSLSKLSCYSSQLFFSFPINTGEFFLNLGIRSRFLTLKRNTAFIFAVDQLSYILEKEEVKTIIKIEDHESEILPRLKKNSRLRNRVILLCTKILTLRSKLKSLGYWYSIFNFLVAFFKFLLEVFNIFAFN